MTIWVDAICINQAADDEKNTQIPLMGTIYTWARVVYIWLGCGSEATDKAIECLLRASTMGIFPGGVPWLDGNGTKTAGKDRLRFAKNFTVGIYKNMPFSGLLSFFRFKRHCPPRMSEEALLTGHPPLNQSLSVEFCT